MKLSTILSAISIEDVRNGRRIAAILSQTGRRFSNRCDQIIEAYPSAGLLMTIEPRDDHELFTKEKITAYSATCHLLATLAEKCDGLSDALATITEEEMLAVVEEILSTDKMAFAEWFLVAGQPYYGYAQGMWEEFLLLLNSGKNAQSIGHLIIAGGLIMIAENRDAPTSRPPRFSLD